MTTLPPVNSKGPELNQTLEVTAGDGGLALLLRV